MSGNRRGGAGAAATVGEPEDGFIDQGVSKPGLAGVFCGSPRPKNARWILCVRDRSGGAGRAGVSDPALQRPGALGGGRGGAGTAEQSGGAELLGTGGGGEGWAVLPVLFGF